jgi:hypothetical protein
VGDSGVVADHHAALHNEFDALHLRHVGEGVAGNRDDVGEFLLFKAADVILPVIASTRSSRRNPKAWEWGYRSVVRSSKPMTVGYGLRPA